MNSKKLISLVLLFMLILALPNRVSAAESISVELPFTVENVPGTVVLEAQDGAPAPTQGEFTDVTEGKFELSFLEAGDYYYKVYQKKADISKESNIIYDSTVYDVFVSVVYGESGELVATVVVSIAGNANKPDDILFENESGTTSLDIKKVAKKDGVPVYGVMTGDIITYEITVENTGDAMAMDVIIVDTLPEEKPRLIVDEVFDGGVMSEDRESITWNIPKIPVGESAVVSFTVKIPTVTEDVDWVNVVATNCSNPVGMTSGFWYFGRATSTIHQCVEACITKMQAKNDEERTTEIIYVTPGDVITYSIDVINNSEGTASDMTVTDVVPDGLRLIMGSVDNGGIVDDDVITWNLGDLKPGEYATVSFKCTVLDVTEETHWFNIANGMFTDESQEEQGNGAAMVNLSTNRVEAVYTPREEPEPDGPGTPTPEPDEPGGPGNPDDPNNPGTPNNPGDSNNSGDSNNPGDSGYYDTQNPDNASGGSSNASKTGDNSNISMWIILMFMAFTGMVGCVLWMRRKTVKKYLK